MIFIRLQEYFNSGAPGCSDGFYDSSIRSFPIVRAPCSSFFYHLLPSYCGADENEEEEKEEEE